MNTKEAIKFFEDVISCIKSANFIYIRRLDDKRFDEIIALLKRGEKIKKMWEGLKRDNKEVTFYDEMKNYEKKYLK